MTAVTPEAVAAAAPVVHRLMSLPEDVGSEPDELDRAAARQVLEAAAPHLACTAEHLAGGLLAENTRLRALAAEILASYVKTGDGYRGRVGQVQIQRWQQQLGGE